MIDVSILKTLADGKFHSGTDIGNKLSLSRTAIWKQIQLFKDYGVDVYSVRGRGYRLPNGLDLLNEDKLQKYFSEETSKVINYLELATVTDSTNLMALRNIKRNDHAALYTAEFQSAGRGRRGRAWVGPLASNLYFSLIWRFAGGAASLEGLSLLVGLSIVEGLELLGIKGIEVKWPNDLLYSGRKLAGILLEMQGDASGEVSVVIGVGINVLMEQCNDITKDIDQPWIDLVTITNKKVDRNEMLATLLNRIIVNISVFEKMGFGGFVDSWHRYHAFQDHYVKLLTGDNEIEGICRGVNERGALLLERFGKKEAFYGGELSVRRSILNDQL